MKKVFLNLLALVLALVAQSQTPVTLSGTVTNAFDGSPMADWVVYATAGDSLVYIFNSGTTEANGTYQFVVDVPAGFSDITVSTFTGCVNPANPDPVSIQIVQPVNGGATADFLVCDDQPPFPNCFASAWYELTGGLSVNFQGEYYNANGELLPATALWDFGDGTTSTESNPTHEYALDGIYFVTLTLTGADGCVAVSVFEVYFFDDPVKDCSAVIELAPGNDSLTFLFTGHLFSLDTSATASAYLWDFGDGATSTLANPTHTYQNAAFYLVTLSITSSVNCTAITQAPLYTDFPVFPACQALINYQQTDILSFDFDAIAFSANGDSIAGVQYLWDFGDGTSSMEAAPSHTYAAQGLYSVLLTLTTAASSTNDTCVAQTSIVVFAFDSPVDTFWYGCQAMFFVAYGEIDTLFPAGGGNPLTLSFFDASFGAAIMWSWDFGDGATSSEQNPVHTYAADGTYTVSLTIITADGCESTAVFEVFVGDNFPWYPELDCQAFFIPLPDSVGGNGIQFLNLSFSNSITLSYAWDFGDGTTSTEENPYHVYAQPGVYTVSLTITADSCNSIIYFEIDTENPLNFNREPSVLGLAANTSGITEIPGLEGLTCFPNPAAEVMNFAFTAKTAGNLDLSILDLAGKTLFLTQQPTFGGANVVNMNVSKLVPGIYFARLRTADRTQTIRFIKG